MNKSKMFHNVNVIVTFNEENIPIKLTLDPPQKRAKCSNDCGEALNASGIPTRYDDGFMIDGNKYTEYGLVQYVINGKWWNGSKLHADHIDIEKYPLWTKLVPVGQHLEKTMTELMGSKIDEDMLNRIFLWFTQILGESKDEMVKIIKNWKLSDNKKNQIVNWILTK